MFRRILFLLTIPFAAVIAFSAADGAFANGDRADGTAVPGPADVPQPELDPADPGGITLSNFTYTVSFQGFSVP